MANFQRLRAVMLDCFYRRPFHNSFDCFTELLILNQGTMYASNKGVIWSERRFSIFVLYSKPLKSRQIELEIMAYRRYKSID